jgi:hypothetical protein
MSLIDDFGDPERNSRARWMNRLSHLVPWGMAIYTIHALLGYTGLFYVPWFGVIVGMVAALTLIMFSVHSELSRMCIRCMEDVPHDAPVRAQKKLHWLKFRHYSTGWKPYLGFLAIILGISALKNFLGFENGEGLWLFFPVDVIIMSFYWSYWIHHRYRSWCPYCKRWDDGHENVEIPDPTTSGVK